MSSIKTGFSTLNRWLGKKNKDKVTPNGKLSKSSANLSLSVSSININETSQLEYNRITPLPAATSNAPFEQTFRITVLLPRDQLYVTRLGARVPLSKLLELVCDNKLLDSEKYEFRNPVDPSQVYSCDLTIGAVGLSEIRLCHKSESYDTFNTDEVIKLHRTTIIRDSLSSSSEFSSRNSKLTTKTPSPYSSSNSLNSMDSTGMNYTRTPVTPPAGLPATTASASKILAPPRKKRVAPRPPSQVGAAPTIHEKSDIEEIAELRNNTNAGTNLPRKNYCVSTPNLNAVRVQQQQQQKQEQRQPNAADDLDCNGNNKLSNGISNGHGEHNDDVDNVRILEAQKNSRNTYTGSVQNLSSGNQSVVGTRLPEPTPRKRLIQIKKKAAPAPPPRGSGAADDTISIYSTTASINTPSELEAEFTDTELHPDAIETPKPSKREFVHASTPEQRRVPEPLTPNAAAVQQQQTVHLSLPATPTTPTVPITPATTPTTPATPNTPSTPVSASTQLPTPVPRSTTTTLLNASPIETNSEPHSTTANSNNNNNVSKVLLNRTPTPEPRSFNSDCNDVDDDNVSKQADSGIGEPIPSPIPDSLPSEGSAQESKSNFESTSSDDDEMVKVYNFKLGKTLVKTVDEDALKPTLAELTKLAEAQTDSGETTPAPNSNALPATPTSYNTEVTSWNFAIPISPPPNFADNDTQAVVETKLVQEDPPANIQVMSATDVPITPKIKARPVLNFEDLAIADTQAKANQQQIINRTAATIQRQASTPHNEVVDELATIIHEQRMDSLIKKKAATNEIEAAKPNTLKNFSIGAAATGTNTTTAPPTTMEVQKRKQKEQQQEQEQLKKQQEQIQKQEQQKEQEQLKKQQQQRQQQEQEPEKQHTTNNERIYRRNSSSSSGSNGPTKTQPLQRRSITRADSFQASIKSNELLAGLSTRSSSQLSLTKIEQNGLSLNRRRSSSELSIGETPTLQSPEVIKTILCSRKNSLANSGSDDGEQVTATSPPITANKPKSNNSVNHNPTERLIGHDKVVTEQVDAIIPAKSKQAATPATAEVPVAAAQAPAPLPVSYRYSGPPTINFSTWSERPKVQVSIKNEGDYIFGGKNAINNVAATATANHHRHSTLPTIKTHNNNTNDESPETTQITQTTRNGKLTIDAASPILRMGIPRKEYKVPITVKPLRDVTIDETNIQQAVPASGSDQNAVSQRSSVININGGDNIQIQTQTQTQIQNQIQSQNQNQSRSTSTAAHVGSKDDANVVRRPPPSFNTNVATLPRANHHNSNRYTMPAATPAFLRNTSITQLRATADEKPKQTTTTTIEIATNNKKNETTATVAPFGQNTLRRTGFKEKMLAQEQAAQQEQAERTVASKNSAAVLHINGKAVQRQQPATMPKPLGITTTSITLKPVQATTKATTTTTMNMENENHTTKTTIKSAKLELKLQPNNDNAVQQQQQAAVFTINTAGTPPAPPPAPTSAPIAPPAVVTFKPTRSVSAGGGTAAAATADPRSALLDAIRNFKRDELNRT